MAAAGETQVGLGGAAARTRSRRSLHVKVLPWARGSIEKGEEVGSRSLSNPSFANTVYEP